MLSSFRWTGVLCAVLTLSTFAAARADLTITFGWPSCGSAFTYSAVPRVTSFSFTPIPDYFGPLTSSVFVPMPQCHYGGYPDSHNTVVIAPPGSQVIVIPPASAQSTVIVTRPWSIFSTWPRPRPCQSGIVVRPRLPFSQSDTTFDWLRNMSLGTR